MNTNNIALRAAVVIALGTVPALASATVYSPGTPVTLASELVVGAGDPVFFAPATYGITIDMKEFINHTIGSSAPLEIKMTLTDGATFKGVTPAALSCNYANADPAVSLATPAQSILNGADGETVVTFKLPPGGFTTTVANAVCIFGGAAAGITLTSGSKGGNATYGMTVSAYLKSVIVEEEVKKSLGGPIVAFKQAYGITVLPGEVTIDVADPSFSQKFMGTNLDDKNAVLGILQYKVIDANVVSVTAGLVGEIHPIDAGADLLPTGNFTVTLSGTPLMAAAGGTTVSVGRGATDIAACAAAVVPTGKNPTVSGTVTFNDIVATDLGTVVFCYKVDGGTRVDKGLITFDLTAPSDPDKQPNVTVTGEKVLTTFYKNGTSVKILTIPDPTDLNNELNIRIYNMGTSAVKVFGSLYKADGTLLGTKNSLLGTIDPNAVKVIKSGGPAPKNMEVATVFGLTTWGGGRAWMQIEGDSQLIRVQALAKTAGTLVNMSDRVIEDSGTFKRPGTN